LATLIEGDNISEAWLLALEHLLANRAVDVNLSVAIAAPSEDARVRAVLDRFLDRHSKTQSRKVWPVSTVANTIFPQAYYQPRLGTKARQHLYALHNESLRVHRRVENDNYFDRLVNWPGSEGTVNQLERLVHQLSRQISRGGALGSASELATSHPRDDTAIVGDLRVHAPGVDRRLMGFPCLSHSSVTVSRGTIHLTALYRNQHFIRRAYGNYLGLARIVQFLASECGGEVGEIVCVASHADAEVGGNDGFGRGELQELVKECRQALDAERAPLEVSGAA
jgi:hypothetical protein